MTSFYIPHSIFRLYIPILSTLIIYMGLLQLSDFVLGVENYYFGLPFKYWALYFPIINFNGSLIPDILIQIVIGSIIFLLSKNTYLFILLQTIYMTLIYGGLALHISYFGSPAAATDIYSFYALIEIISINEKIAMSVPFILMISIFFYNFRYSVLNCSGVLLLLIVLPSLVVANAKYINTLTNIFYPYKVWDKKYNYDSRGASIYILQEVAMLFINKEYPPSQEEVVRIRNRDVNKLIVPTNHPQPVFRNIHLIVVESLWDARSLQGAGLSEDPFDSRFRKLWVKTNNSKAMSPVFGGGTANAEFEILCGQPVTIEGIVFQIGLKNETVPCLPNMLSNLGYHSVATHPNVASFWNRVHSYRRLGFSEYKSEHEINMDDMSGGYLSNASLFRQNRKYLADMPEGIPVFNYVLTIAEHWKYSLNEKRPDIVSSTSKDDFVKRYVNVIKYSTMELMNHLDKLRSSDPNALIIVLGDHLPLFGANMLGYRESNLFLKEKGEFSAQDAELYASTPLIIIDGYNGPQSLGTISMFELPAVISSYIGAPVLKSQTVFLPIDNYSLRPVNGVGLLVSSSDESFLCKGMMANTKCEKYEQWMDDVKLLSRDLRIGHQYLLKE